MTSPRPPAGGLHATILFAKGRRASARPHTLLGPRHRGPVRPGGAMHELAPLVGRASELAFLEARVSALARGRGGVVLIAREAGTGKSRLVGRCAEARASEG